MKLITTMLLMSLLATSCGNPHVSSSDGGLEQTSPPTTPDDDGETGGTSGGETSGSTTGGVTAGSTTGGSTAGSTTGGSTAGSTTGSSTAGSTTGGSTAGSTGGATGGSTTGGSTGGQTCVPSPTQVRDYRFFYGSRAEGQAGVTPTQYEELTKCRVTVNETFNSKRDGFTHLVTNKTTNSFYYEMIHQTEKKWHPEKVNYLRDIFGTDTYSMEIENPVSQNGATGRDRGVDSHSANSTTKDALVWSFSTPVSFWGGQFVDVESSPSEPAMLRLYDCDKRLVKESKVVYPNREQGQVELHFIGFISPTRNICHVSLTVGDYEQPAPWTSRAFYRALAVDGFTYGK